MNESWRHVWRDGVAPQLSLKALECLRDALLADDPRLLQGATTSPPPLAVVSDWPTEAACLLGFVGWQGDGLETVAEVEEFFARTCFESDQRIGEPAASRWLTNFWDDTPRREAIAALLPEVEASIALRANESNEPTDYQGAVA